MSDGQRGKNSAGGSRRVQRIKRAVLVYQAGIANVFSVTSFNLSDYGRDAKRFMQLDFRTCEAFARGLQAAGVVVRSAQCNQAGDISGATWSEDLQAAPFSDKFCPVAPVCYRCERHITESTFARELDGWRHLNACPVG